jgi:hypothetical protein
MADGVQLIPRCYPRSFHFDNALSNLATGMEYSPITRRDPELLFPSHNQMPGVSQSNLMNSTLSDPSAGTQAMPKATYPAPNFLDMEQLHPGRSVYSSQYVQRVMMTASRTLSFSAS